MLNLERILQSLSSNKIPVQDLEKTFDEIAVRLLRETKIVTPCDQFYFREIEFYYRSPTHNDPYVHGYKGCKSTAAKQGNFGEWYFHRFKTIENFLKIYRNGVDITFGNNNENVYGGILIRKIQSIENKSSINGINKVARTIIEAVNDNKELENIATTFGNRVFDTNQRLRLDIEYNSSDLPIYKVSRFGLNVEKDKSKEYFSKPLCYYNHIGATDISNKIQVSPAL